jgi:hypothetical protein
MDGKQQWLYPKQLKGLKAMKNGVADFLVTVQECDARMCKKELKMVTKKTNTNH